MSLSFTSKQFFLLTGCLLLPGSLYGDEALLARGAKIYTKLCAECHGANGEGTADNHPSPLFGDRSTIELAEVIETTMPEGEAKLCTGKDAQAVAAWMQTAFYSPEAQARLNPPKKKLSRLTVLQYRNAVADLAESFTWSVEPNELQGLTGRYYKSRHFRDKDKVIERLDVAVNFDFGEGTPDKKKVPDNEQFSIRWEGSLVIDQTGWYDMTLRTENAGRLYLNNKRTPLIDASVKSGDVSEYSASLFLLAGRLYPLTVEWFTFKEKTASVGLWWKPPHGVSQPVPSRHLSPQKSTQVLVIETPFPPDDRSDGYIRGTSISAEWHEATTFAAIEAVDRLTEMLPEIAGVRGKDTEEERRKKLINFCRVFVFRAFRRPVSEQEQLLYVDRHFKGNLSTGDAVRRSLLAVLKSPRFLYRNVTRENDNYAKASRLSFALLGTLPDKNLLKAAEKGWIENEKGLRDQAWRLLNSWRGRIRLQEFLRSWLNLERLEEIDKDEEVFEDFGPELVADMRASLEMSLYEAAGEREGSFTKLMTDSQIWLNDRLAEFYNVDLPQSSDTTFRKVDFEQDHRAGIISHPFLMSAFAYQTTSSPIHRGVFLSRGILGRTLKPPPDSVTPVAPDLEPHLTTRERVSRQTSPPVCNSCHSMINSLGFALEEFDAVGRFRKSEKNRSVDAGGNYRLRSGELVEFRGATELAEFLAKSSETHRSFSRQLFHYMVQQPILAYGADTINRLAAFFAAHQFDIRQLMVEVAVASATSVDQTKTASPQ